MKKLVSALLVSSCLSIGVNAQFSNLTQIDLEITLTQYKEIRTEQLKIETQLKLLNTDESHKDSSTQKLHRQRLENRVVALRSVADEFRAKATDLERQLEDGPRRKADELSAVGPQSAGQPESDLSKRMLGTWQLVSFVDGRVSDANVGELKFIGDRHWSVSRINPSTGKLDYHMGGTYTLDGNEYVETIEYGTGGPIGETYTYTLTVEGDKFTQLGAANPWSLVFKRAK